MIAGSSTLAALPGCSDGADDSATHSHRSPLNAEYLIDGQRIYLENGAADVAAAPGSASRSVTRYTGIETRADLDGDGRPDTVLLLTHAPGGSGTFYYVVAALDRPEGLLGSRGLLLGDRIAPRSMTAAAEGRILVNLAERAPGDSFAIPPSVDRSLSLRFNPESLQFDAIDVTAP